MKSFSSYHSFSLTVIVLANVFLAGCGGIGDVPEGTLISILYTSDTRGKLEGCGCKHNGGGITKRSAKLVTARENDPDILYCDAGNFLTGTDEADAAKGQLTVAAYNLMKTTVVNLSERELAAGIEAFKDAKKDSKFDYMSANVRLNGSTLADAYVVKKIKEARVAFVGLCGTKEIMRYDSSKFPDGVTVDDPLETAKQVLPSLVGKVEILVVLSTCGDATDSLIAQAFPTIDLIIGGRSYRPNENAPWVIGKTRIVRAQRDGRTMGRMDMVFGADRKIKTYSASVVNMETGDPSDGQMLSLIRQFIPSFTDNPN